VTFIKRAINFLLEYEIWLVGALVAGSFITARLLPVAAAAAALYWPLRWLGRRRLSLRTPADGGILVLLLMAPVTLWASALPEKTIPQVYRLLAGIGLFYAIVNWTDSTKRLRLLLAGLLLAALGLAGFALVSVQWSTTKLPFIPAAVYARLTTLVADVVHPNVMAGSLVLLLPLGLATLLFGWGRLPRGQFLAVAGIALFTSAVLLLTKSRGAWMGFGAILITLVLLRGRWGWLGLALAVLLSAAAIYRLGLSPVMEIVTANAALSGVEGRVEIWSRAVYMIQDFPFTGVGMGSFGEVADILYPFFLAAPGTIPHAHNLFLQVAVDLGLPGLIGWLAVWLVVMAVAWRVYRAGWRRGDLWAAGLGAGLLGAQLALVVHGLTDAVTWGMVRPAPLVWAVWGLAIAAGQLYLPQAARPAEKRDAAQEKELPAP